MLHVAVLSHSHGSGTRGLAQPLSTYWDSPTGAGALKVPTYFWVWVKGKGSLPARALHIATDMIALTISSSQPQFTQFLLERLGIEGNILTVNICQRGTRRRTQRAERAARAYRAGLQSRITSSYLLTHLPSTGPAAKQPLLCYLPLW